MKYTSLLMAMILILGLVGCSGDVADSQASEASQEQAPPEESKVEALENVQQASIAEQLPTGSTPEFSADPKSFWDDPEFLAQAYAMGYTDECYIFTRDNWRTDPEQYLNPAINYIVSISPDEKYILFSDGEGMDSRMFSKNLETGALWVYDIVLGWCVNFISNDTFALVYNTGGGIHGNIYTMDGTVIEQIDFDDTDMSYTIQNPIYHLETDCFMGFGMTLETFKEYSTWNGRIDHEENWQWVVIDRSRRTIVSVEDFGALIAGWHAEDRYVRNGYIWVYSPKKQEDADSRYYKIDMLPPYTMTEITFDEYKANGVWGSMHQYI